jgi:hypothetical protein
MSTTLRPPANRTTFKVIANGNLCGVFTDRYKSGVIAISVLLSACTIKTTIKSHDEILATTTETDLQAALTNVVQPIQAEAALEARVPMVRSYWYNEDESIVCQVGDYCITLDSIQ